MATLLSRNSLREKMCEVVGKNYLQLIDKAKESTTIEEMIELQMPIFENMSVQFTGELLKELERLGVDLSPVWGILHKEKLLGWSK